MKNPYHDDYPYMRNIPPEAWKKKEWPIGLYDDNGNLKDEKPKGGPADRVSNSGGAEKPLEGQPNQAPPKSKFRYEED